MKKLIKIQKELDLLHGMRIDNILRVAGINKKSGPTKNMFSACNLVPIINPPFADNKEHLVFRHFSRYLCYPMLKLMKKLRKLIDDPAS